MLGTIAYAAVRATPWALTASAWGLLMVASSFWLLQRARRRHDQLLQRKRELEAAL